jgi:serine/threonine-protein kinase
MVPVPDVREYYDYSAEEILVNDGFKVKVVYAYQEGYADRGVAWGTDPATGTMAPQGSTITVFATPEDFRQPQIDS